MKQMNYGLLLKKGKLILVVSAYCLESKRIDRLSLGSRSYKTLNRVLILLQLTEDQKTYTDKLKHYSFLIKNDMYSTKLRMTNNLERIYLNLRIRLKRLHIGNIGFSWTVLMLVSILKIYL